MNASAPGLPRFGPGALLTPANLVTVSRLALTLPLLAVISADGASWRSALSWIALGSTDGVDGWLARRSGATRSGAFLDPLADKFLAIGGLSALAAKGVFPWLPVVLIAVREVAVSAYRTVAGRRGICLPARGLGKLKTVSQLVAVGAALVPLTASTPGIALALLWAAVGLTLVSGFDILRHGGDSGGFAAPPGAPTPGSSGAWGPNPTPGRKKGTRSG